MANLGHRSLQVLCKLLTRKIDRFLNIWMSSADVMQNVQGTNMLYLASPRGLLLILCYWKLLQNIFPDWMKTLFFFSFFVIRLKQRISYNRSFSFESLSRLFPHCKKLFRIVHDCVSKKKLSVASKWVRYENWIWLRVSVVCRLKQYSLILHRIVFTPVQRIIRQSDIATS